MKSLVSFRDSISEDEKALKLHLRPQAEQQVPQFVNEYCNGKGEQESEENRPEDRGEHHRDEAARRSSHSAENQRHGQGQADCKEQDPEPWFAKHSYNSSSPKLRKRGACLVLAVFAPLKTSMVKEMSEVDYRQYITIEPGKRGGRPCIRGMRITVGDVLGWLSSGMTHEEIIGDFPEITEEDIRAALGYAADRERRVAPVLR